MSGAMLGAAFFRMLKRARQTAKAAEEAAEAACDVVEWEEQWNADDAACGEDGGAEERGAGLAIKDVDSAEDVTLASRYQKFMGDTLETPLYTANSELKTDAKAEAELCRVLGRAFSRVIGYVSGSDMRSSAVLMQAIAHETGYQVDAVSSVMNRALYNMHRQFGLSYGVHATQTVYHGTSEESANSMVLTGFKGAACKRSKLGRGSYVASDIFNATAYAEPKEGMQHVLVTEVMKGPTGLGRPEQVACISCIA
jgi:hypothetical protein